MELFTTIYNILWGDLIQIPLPGGSTLGLSLLVLILIPAGLYFTIRTRFLPFRLFPEMIRVTLENTGSSGREGISGVQALIISTACRVGMGNLVGVVAAISAGGAGAVFWMWVIALLGSSTAFIEATLAQLYKEKDPLYGGYRGGPAYYLHHLFIKPGSKRRRSLVASLFALSGLICWCGISQVTANSISSSFENAFQIPPLYSTIALVLLAAVIVLIAYIGAVMGLFSVSHTPKFASGDAGMAFGGILMNLRRALSNFGSLLTGTRNVLSFGFGAVSPPSGHVPGAPSLDDLPLEYLFSLILSVLNTVLLCLMFILGIFSLCHTFVKRRKFAKVMNEIVLDGELKILSDEELEEILSFGEEKPTAPPPECPHAARGEEPAPVEAQTDTAARPSDGEEKT